MYASDSTLRDFADEHRLRTRRDDAAADPGDLSLPELTRRFQRAEEEGCRLRDRERETSRRKLRQFRLAGHAAAAIKEKLPHGKWGGWVEKNARVGKRQVQRYMLLARHWKLLEKTTRVSDFPMSLRDAVTRIREELQEDDDSGDGGADDDDGDADEDEPAFEDVPSFECGEVRRLGRHRILSADSTDPDHLRRVLDGDGATICFTSPPYNVGQPDSDREHWVDRYEGYDDHLDDGDYVELLCNSLNAVLEVCDLAFYVVSYLTDNRGPLNAWVNEFNDHFKEKIYWVKDNAAPHIVDGILKRRVEEILVFSARTNPSRAFENAQFEQGQASDVIPGNNAAQTPYVDKHGATFPPYLAKRIIRDFTAPGDVILDPFAGTGTTLVAAEETDRRCCAVDISPLYCRIIHHRWLAEMGREKDGREEMAA